jgi:hypothetical protein
MCAPKSHGRPLRGGGAMENPGAHDGIEGVAPTAAPGLQSQHQLGTSERRFEEAG